MAIDRPDAAHSAQLAMELLRERMAACPGYAIYAHAHAQLARVLDELRRSSLPGPLERQWLDIGLMAARELEAADRELACALMDADYDFKHAARERPCLNDGGPTDAAR